MLLELTPEHERLISKASDHCPQAPTPTSVLPSSSQAPPEAKQLPCNSTINGKLFFFSSW